MSHLAILLIAGLFFWDGVSTKESSTEKLQIVKDIGYLSVKAKNITQEVEQLMNSYALNNAARSYQTMDDDYDIIMKQISTKGRCMALRNNLAMIVSHIKDIAKECYERGQRFLQSIVDKAHQLRKAIIDQMASWNANNSTQSRMANIPLPMLLHNAKNLTDNDIMARIELLKIAVERFEIAKKLKETESKQSARFCGFIVKSYNEEARNLLSSIKECLIPPRGESTTIKSDQSSGVPISEIPVTESSPNN